MKVLYWKSSNEILAVSTDAIETAEVGVADVPAGFEDDPRQFGLWKYDPMTSSVVKKTGSEGDDAAKALKLARRDALRKKYVGAVVSNRGCIGLEDAIDILVQVVEKLVDAKPLTTKEKKDWQDVVQALKNDYRLKLGSLTTDEADELKDAKKAIRKAETDMKADPSWPA